MDHARSPKPFSHETKYPPVAVWCLGSLALVAFLVTAGAWATEKPAEKPAGEQVGQRAVQRWQALIAGDFQKAYTYLSPGYRAVTPYGAYRGHFGQAVAWTGVALKTVRCEKNVCDVNVDIEYRALGRIKMPGNALLREKWVRASGDWWLLPKK